MEKYRYFVTNTFNGCLEGTNDSKVAEDLASCEDFFVVDSEDGKWMTPEGKVDVLEYGN